MVIITEICITQGSGTLRDLFSYTLQILWFLELGDVCGCDYYALMQNIIIPSEKQSARSCS